MHFAICSSSCAGEGAADDPQLERCSREDLQHGDEDLHRAGLADGEFDSVSTICTEFTHCGCERTLRLVRVACTSYNDLCTSLAQERV